MDAVKSSMSLSESLGGDSVALRDLAVTLAEAGDFHGAVRHFRDALTVIRTDPDASPSPRDLAAIHDMLAQCLMEVAVLAEEEGSGVEGGEGGKGAVRALGKEVERARWEEALHHAAEACRLSPRIFDMARSTACTAPTVGGNQHYSASRAAAELSEREVRLTAHLGAATATATAAQMATICTTAAESAVMNVSSLEARPTGKPFHGSDYSHHNCSANHLNCHNYHDLDVSEQITQPLTNSVKEEIATDPNLDPDLESELAAELREVSELWQERLAREVGLPGLRMQQNAGVIGEGPGRRLWECGVLLASYIVRHAALQGAVAGTAGAAPKGHLRGARVLELGCGMGLVGICAAACGADCILTDLPPVLPAARACAAANARLVAGGGGRVRVRVLDWAAAGHCEGEVGDEELPPMSVPAATAAAAWLMTGRGPWAVTATEGPVDADVIVTAAAAITTTGSPVGAITTTAAAAGVDFVLREAKAVE
ncbi:hypothetical protein VaNZ11_007976, partial [Volvox africanus]